MTDRAEYFRAYNANRDLEKKRAYAKAHPEYVRAYQERHGDTIRARSRARRAADPEAARARDKARRDANPDRVWAGSLRVFSLTIERYESMLREQDGRCAICRQPERWMNPRTGQPHRLQVDHDHRCCTGSRSCGKCVRGLLCHACNGGGGKFGDDPDLLRAAADYFESA